MAVTLSVAPLLALAVFVLFIRWGTKSIPHAIVFVVVFPILLMVLLGALTAFKP